MAIQFSGTIAIYDQNLPPKKEKQIDGLFGLFGKKQTYVLEGNSINHSHNYLVKEQLGNIKADGSLLDTVKFKVTPVGINKKPLSLLVYYSGKNLNAGGMNEKVLEMTKGEKATHTAFFNMWSFSFDNLKDRQSDLLALIKGFSQVFSSWGFPKLEKRTSLFEKIIAGFNSLFKKG